MKGKGRRWGELGRSAKSGLLYRARQPDAANCQPMPSKQAMAAQSTKRGAACGTANRPCLGFRGFVSGRGGERGNEVAVALCVLARRSVSPLCSVSLTACVPCLFPHIRPVAALGGRDAPSSPGQHAYSCSCPSLGGRAGKERHAHHRRPVSEQTNARIAHARMHECTNARIQCTTRREPTERGMRGASCRRRCAGLLCWRLRRTCPGGPMIWRACSCAARLLRFCCTSAATSMLRGGRCR